MRKNKAQREAERLEWRQKQDAMIAQLGHRWTAGERAVFVAGPPTWVPGEAVEVVEVFYNRFDSREPSAIIRRLRGGENDTTCVAAGAVDGNIKKVA